MGFGGSGKRAPAPDPKHIPLPLEPPKDMAADMLYNLALGLFCLLAVLFIGQVGRLLVFIGGKLASAMCPPIPKAPARRKRLSAAGPTHGSHAGHGGSPAHHTHHHHNNDSTPMPPPQAGKALWPYYKRGKSIADDPNGLQQALSTSPNVRGFGPTGAGASSTVSCRSDCSGSSDASSPCCSPPARSRAASPLGIAGKEKKVATTNPLEIRSPLLSAEAAAEQRRLRREQAEEYEEMEAMLKEQEARLGEQEEVLARHYHERAIKLVGYLLDDMFERDPDKGSTLVNTIPAGLKHQCFMAELYRRMMEAEAHGMVHAASNPMAIKRANDDTFEAQVDQARKGLTPRRARKVTDALALKKEERQGPNYPHPPRFRPPDVKERTKWWWYYQMKNAEEGKYHHFLAAAFQSPDGFPTDNLPLVQCGCCFKPNQQKPFTLGGDRNEALPRVFGPQEYSRPNIRV